jgi:addiction module HigA family antidote
MASHPGHLLRDTVLAPLGLSPAELARGLGVERSSISRLLAGEQSLTPTMAARLGRYFQVPALWFLEMQAAYDAERLSADPSVTEGVTPRRRDRNFLLTPGGARPLGARSSKPSEPLRIPYEAFDRNAPAPSPTSHAVRQVEDEGGGVALVCEPK